MIRVESDLSEAYNNDLSYEVSCPDINFVPCPKRFSCSAAKINLVEKIGE